MLACSLLVDDQRPQCESNKDCTSRGSAFSSSECVSGLCEEIEVEDEETKLVSCDDDDDECEADERCIEKKCKKAFECEEELPDASSSSVPVVVTVGSAFGDSLPGIPARLCRILDPQCDSPVMNLITDKESKLQFDLPAGFNGYLDFNTEPYFPMLFLLPPNPQPDEVLGNASLSPVQVVQGLGAAVGAQPDPERGHLLLAIEDCFGPAAGIEISSPHEDDDSITYYVLDGVPAADHSETTVSGSSGFLNFRPGNAAVTLSFAKNNEDIGKISVITRAGYLTSATFEAQRVP